jgi:hypothetical protein
MKLFQKSQMSVTGSGMFLDYKQLQNAIVRPGSKWVITEVDGTPVSVFALLIDPMQKLCKINKMLVDREVSGSETVLRESLRYCLHMLENDSDVEVVYTTTLSLTREQQDCTAREGFKVLGVFPNALGEDNSKLNGLTAYFLKDAIKEKRYNKIVLHPVIARFYKISAMQCKLPELPVMEYNQILEEVRKFEDSNPASNVPYLELIRAPEFVREKFRELMDKKSHLANFYPFYRPNSLITDPKREIEIYVDIYEPKRFAAIIGEHVKKPVHPVALYNEVQKLLRKVNVSYVEIINDAGDCFGNECILRGGFTPCAYFPSFKSQGNYRRDYVVFGRSYEYLYQPSPTVNKAYMDFFKEYLEVEMHKYFSDISPSTDLLLKEIFVEHSKG